MAGSESPAEMCKLHVGIGTVHWYARLAWARCATNLQRLSIQSGSDVRLNVEQKYRNQRWPVR